MPDAIVEQWAREPPLTAEVRRPLAELNRGFLELRGFAAPQFAQLAPAQIAAAADCPYALFDLRFDDPVYWAGRLGPEEAWRGVEDSQPADPEAVAFVRTALFYGWHLASTTGLRARLLLGMHDRTVLAFAAAPLRRLDALAIAESGQLRLRWPERDSFWRALAEAARHADTTELRRVQLHGLQFAAAARLR
ncbi:MAG: hypothetical protein KGL34_12705 [Gammaproteobacteria bacterium]|nr:hypothetical protein [Gammaproteobacteria bacterium]